MAKANLNEWIDCDDNDRIRWAVSYLNRNGQTYRGRKIVDASDISRWVIEVRDDPSRKDAFKRMCGAWAQRKLAAKKASNGKVSCNHFITEKADSRLKALASRRDIDIAEALELVLSTEHIKASLLDAKLKEARTKIKSLEAKARIQVKAIHRATGELAKCAAAMHQSGISLESLDQTQPELNAKLKRDFIVKLFNGSQIAAADLLISRSMERPLT